MLTALALTMSLASVPATSEGVRLPDVSAGLSARLLAQSPPPLPVRPSEVSPQGGRALQLQGEIDAINDQLRGLDTNWPTVSIVMAYVGWSISPIALIGLVLMAVPFPSVFMVGVVVLVIGLAGVALGIAGLVTGVSAANAAKAERDELIRRRETLQRELRALGHHWAPHTELLTVASF